MEHGEEDGFHGAAFHAGKSMRGALMPGKPVQVQDATEAERLVAKIDGVVAFSQTADADAGDCDLPVLIRRIGDLPPNFMELMS